MRLEIKAKKLPLQLLTFVLLALLIIPLFRTKAYASDFLITINRTYTYEPEQELIHIEETRNIQSFSNAYYIKQDSTESFVIQNFKEGVSQEELDIKKNSISVSSPTYGELSHKVEQQGDELIVTARYPTDVTADKSVSFTLEYDSNELIENIGKITNIYIPGFKEDQEDITINPENGLSTEVSYNTILKIPQNEDLVIHSAPEPTKIYNDSGFKVYEYSTDILKGKSVWYQMGNEQLYFFKIVQPTTKTDNLTPENINFLSKNEYQVVLPREYEETNQKVYFSKLDPYPNEIFTDNEGNLIAKFLVDANKSSQIVIEGYITINLNKNSEDYPKDVPSNVDISEINTFSDVDKYLQPSEYWEVDNSQIQDKAQELKGDKSNIMEILKADYKFIIESIDYDDFKFGDANTRQGAVATLNGGNSVCMEYSDLLIAISRAQGIPARAAYGYGFDPKLAADNQEEHQWVQVWIPDYGWLTIDPTWGETGREFFGKDIDHVLWYVAAEHPNIPAPIEVLSSTKNVSIKPIQIEFYAVEEISNPNDLMDLNELKNEIENSSTNETTKIIQVSPLGRSFAIVAPSCIGGIILILCLRIISRLISRKYAKKKDFDNLIKKKT